MLYRRSSPHPPKLLLRIVTTASAGAFVVACGGDAFGSVPGTPSDSDAQSPGPCNGGPCGSVAMPTPDASEASNVPVGLVAGPDSGHGGPCNGGPCGVMVMPPDSGHGGPCNGGPCGVIINPEAGFD